MKAPQKNSRQCRDCTNITCHFFNKHHDHPNHRWCRVRSSGGDELSIPSYPLSGERHGMDSTARSPHNSVQVQVQSVKHVTVIDELEDCYFLTLKMQLLQF